MITPKKNYIMLFKEKESGIFVINGKLFSIEVENEDVELRSNFNEDLSKRN
ncbi:hypothetical protein KHA80_05445 [Anaerobacillus sp. HL2]|nr:hypothetical protein KHA80_05445 [Anaerobacillus sp. HL2]